MPLLDNTGLAALLRECATLVDRGETSPSILKGAEALKVYHVENLNESNGINGNSTNSTANTNIPNKNPPPSKPYFQTPNSKSILIANGWIEQQRHSRLKVIWKEILASLVEARRPGEETTLWIQREIRNPQNKNKTELEALHQIPMKWIEEVICLDFYSDYRFSIKVFNVPEDFVFRTGTEESCKQWVATLKSAREASYIATGSASGGRDAVDQAFSSPRRVVAHQRSEHSPDRVAKNSHPMGRRQQEQPMQEQQKQSHQRQEQQPRQPEQHHSHQRKDQQPQQAPFSTEPLKVRMSIKELRAIAHGAGQDTRGMERADLEAIAEHFAPASARYPAPNIPPKMEQETQQPEPTAAAAAADETPKLDPEQEEELMRQQEVYLRQKRAEAAKQKNDDILQRIKEQAAAKAAAELEQKRQKEEEELKKRSDFAEQWSGGGKNTGNTSNQGWGGTHGTATPPTSNTSNLNFQQPQQKPASPTQQQHHPPPMGDPTSPINHKYAKAVTSEKVGDDEATISAIKRNVLIHWALMPPKYNMLRPIDHLLCAIHTVFPPAFGVAQHSYFTRWRQICPTDLMMISAMGNSPDENKLKKAVRKLRVFLHPDRLPRDFNGEQTFVCKMLWDVSNDAWEEFLKHKDDLDWIHK